MSELNDYCNEAIQLTEKCGHIIRDCIEKKKNIQCKTNDIDLVTETDQLVEKILIEGLSKKFPKHKFIGEESVSAGLKCELTNAPTWIIDPVDGTMNFVHSFPHVCISIALLVEKETLIGIIYNPILKLMYTARKGQGAFLNGSRIHVSGETDLSKALLGMEVGTSRQTDRMENVAGNLAILMPTVHGLRSLGSCALDMAAVASGGLDAYFEFGIHAWDIAGGDLIVREAGGVCIDTEGGPLDLLRRRVLCASSQQLADQMVSKLQQMEHERD